MTFEPRTDKGVAGIPMIAQGASLSGCSGAPLIMAVQEVIDGVPRPIDFIVFGAIIGSTKQEGSEGESAEYISVMARRLACIQSDGKLTRPNDGQWLPPHNVEFRQVGRTRTWAARLSPASDPHGSYLR